MSKMRISIKSQAAMEFLLSYGWAILVVLVVIGALSYFGVLNPMALLPGKCYFGGGVGTCDDYMLVYDADPSNGNSDDGVVWILLKNNIGKPIKTAGLDVVSGAECGDSITFRMRPEKKGSELVSALQQSFTVNTLKEYAWLIPAAGTPQENLCIADSALCSVWGEGEQVNIITLNCKGMEKGKRKSLEIRLVYSFDSSLMHSVSGSIAETAQDNPFLT